MILKGRKQIFIDLIEEELKAEVMSGNYTNFINAINTAIDLHTPNANDIHYLLEYKNGVQPILNKQKEVRPEIINRLVLNHAQMATRNIVGYFIGTPPQYIHASADKKDEIDRLNRYVTYEDKHSVDKDIAEYQSACGTAYRMIYTDGVKADEVPFEDKALNPETTFVAYENSVREKPLFGVYFFDKYDGVNILGRKVYCYTSFGVFEFVTSYDLTVRENNLIGFTPYDVGGIPIIEYPNNANRIGDWELEISLMNAINDLNSGRLDDIDQIVQSLLAFVNVEIDADTYDQMREKGVIMLNNKTNLPIDIKHISNSLDQNGVKALSEELTNLLYALIGIPDRNNRAGGGGDTGQAVELRDGWADMEIIARNKENYFKASEKQALKIILHILRTKDNFTINLVDVDIKFSRNKNSNLLVKTQSYVTLVGTKTLSPADCLAIVDLVTDENEYIERGKLFWGDQFAGTEPKQEEATPTEATDDVEKAEDEKVKPDVPEKEVK